MKKKYSILLLIFGVVVATISTSCLKITSTFVPEKKYFGPCKTTNQWFDDSLRNKIESKDTLPNSISEIRGVCNLDDFEISYTYDETGNLVKCVDFRNGVKTVTEKEYNKKNTLISRKRSSSTQNIPWIETTEYFLNKNQQPVKVKQTLQHHGKKDESEMKVSHPTDNEIIAETAEGEVSVKIKTVIEKDKNGNVLKETQSIVETGVVVEEKSYKYDSNGNVVSIIRKYGTKLSEKRFELDKYGNVLSVTHVIDGEKCPTYSVNDYSCWAE